MKVFIFESTRAVIKAETAVRDAGINCKIIPVPRSVSPQCGMAILLDDDVVKEATRLLKEKVLTVKIVDLGRVQL